MEDGPGQSDDPREERLIGLSATIDEHLGDRLGGFWIDRDGGEGVVCVTIVSPTDEDRELLAAAGSAAGREVAVRAVRYSKTDLDGFMENVTSFMADHPGDVWSSAGVRPERNAVEVVLVRDEAATVVLLKSRVPADALEIRIDPDARFSALEADSRARQI